MCQWRVSSCTGQRATGMAAQPHQVVAATKGQAVLQALRGRWEAKTVLIWHVGLLKLLPLFRVGKARVILFLHGIGIWRRLDPLTRLLSEAGRPFPEQQRLYMATCAGLSPNSCGSPPSYRPPRAGWPTPRGFPYSKGGSTCRARGEPPRAGRGLQGTPRADRGVAPRAGTAPRRAAVDRGEGDLRPDLEALVGVAQSERAIHFLGRISEAEKEARLQRCRCFAMPSRGEGFGLVYLEAMRGVALASSAPTTRAARWLIRQRLVSRWTQPTPLLSPMPSFAFSPLGSRGTGGRSRHGSGTSGTLRYGLSNSGLPTPFFKSYFCLEGIT